MRCMNCGADIPPAYITALSRNECPGCGGLIMSEATQELMRELADAMEKMPHDPQGVAGWLLSNYRFQKIGTGEPVEKFHRKGSGIDPSKPSGGNDFVKRSEASNLVAKGEQLAKIKHGNPKMAEMASLIQTVGDPYGDDDVSVDDDPVADEDDRRAYQELQAAGMDPFASQPVGGITDVSQVIDPKEAAGYLNNSGEILSQAEKIYMQSEEGRKILQNENIKKLKAQEAIQGGGGSFRR